MIKRVEHIGGFSFRDVSFHVSGTKIAILVYQAQDPETGDLLMPNLIGPSSFHLTIDLAREMAEAINLAVAQAEEWVQEGPHPWRT